MEIKVHEIKTILGFTEEKPLEPASRIMLLLLVCLDKCVGINFMLFSLKTENVYQLETLRTDAV